uniref:Uncharacterized protein n=1 Tax=Timema poppense TaxID=170557 RepID=A0A7R9D0N9_TIMPO|nr:unnamed protein product [Timema poppensis]CAD7404627.1 unnamed protein product [Timema poppensis]CAD7405964.1 unnamed protein product [Timema poppensis]
MADQSTVSLTSSAEKKLNKGRRRKLSISEWKDNRRKALRNSGSPYISKMNVPVPGKLPSNKGRICKCQFSCDALSADEKNMLFKDYHGLNYDNQTRFLAQQCLEILEVQRRTTPEDISRRQCSVKYYLPLSTGKIRVCQKTLCDALCVTPRRLQILQEKMKHNRPLEDKRGKHRNRVNKISDEVTTKIKEHIDSFPKQESHYSRHKTSNCFLSANLNVRKMYNLFVEQYPHLDVSEWFYRDIFRRDYKLKFGLPRSDSCNYCDKLYIKMLSASSDEEINRIEIESRIHHMRADAAYKMLAQDTERASTTDNLLVWVMDSDDFKDFTVVEGSLNKKDFKITDYHWLQITADDPSTLRGRTSHNILQPFQYFCMAKKRRGKNSGYLAPVNVERLPALYIEYLSVKKEKKDDLLKMTEYMPNECRSFYQDLKTN